VVVIDDSALARKLVSRMLESDPEIKVVGTAMNGVFGLRRIYRDKPDVVTMDFEMPQMDGLETLETLMERHPIPVVMLSAHTQHGAQLTMKALELGAVDFVSKPDGRESEVLTRLRSELVEKVKAAGRAHPHGHASPAEPPAAESVHEPEPVTAPEPKPVPRARTPRKTVRPAMTSDVRLIAIGSSTGGVPGVADILSALPANAPPVLVVQHMPATFTGTFAARLDGMSRVTVTEAEGGEVLEPGMALVARGETHLGVKRDGTALVAEVANGPKVTGHKPSVDFLFWSCARAVGDGLVGVILTGMGKDGGQGLKEIRDAGGRTIAESEESSVIYGMPKEAIKLGGAEFVLGTDEIPSKVVELLAADRGPTQ
jgi:two-component system chemotaxis response regulator CheB